RLRADGQPCPSAGHTVRGRRSRQDDAAAGSQLCRLVQPPTRTNRHALGGSLQGLPSRQRGLRPALLPLHRTQPGARPAHRRPDVLALVQLRHQHGAASACRPCTPPQLAGARKHRCRARVRLPGATGPSTGRGQERRVQGQPVAATGSRPRRLPRHGRDQDPALCRNPTRPSATTPTLSAEVPEVNLTPFWFGAGPAAPSTRACARVQALHPTPAGWRSEAPMPSARPPTGCYWTKHWTTTRSPKSVTTCSSSARSAATPSAPWSRPRPGALPEPDPPIGRHAHTHRGSAGSEPDPVRRCRDRSGALPEVNLTPLPGPRHAARVAPLHNAQRRRQPSMPILALTSWADCAPWRSYGRVRKYLSAGKPAGRTFLSKVTSTSSVPGTSRSNASGNTTASRRALLTVAFSPPLSDMAEARNTYPF